MLTAILLLAASAREADTEVIAMQAPRGLAMAYATVFTNDHLVAGYACDSAIGLGSTSLSTPFVWHNGVLHHLPTGTGEYARVFAGNNEVLVGEASLGGEDWRPAKWTRDTEHGWAKAKMELLGKSGYALR